MNASIHGKKVAVLVANGFEQVELTRPRDALKAAGAHVSIVSPEQGEVKGWDLTDWGQSVPVDVRLSDARAEDFDALVLPGGVMNPDKLRMNEWALQFVRAFFESRKPVAAICHGPWTLIDAGVVSGRTLTSYPSIKADLINAGANWIDQDVVVDSGLITSRKPDDIPAFNRRMIEEFAESAHTPAGT
jgi:protease I